ncbi:ribosomal protein S18 acetylase RimI-like enzyme [Anaerosolibacter carboniphilus]|uniref:Ribosomal protein S18 acetylase RimI-like enzyme n=1 Tax=Anaerosolibacter carboniphilus TaxID=1417629 RepID=A0A841KNM8_9FIRM|nr:GNAT family N-acetyltransferase [Anaerosolibacter carboniphilus]MBB6215404.1 ribosomal protein S18 acetylase RimI-like enzyme [Anaerosolibacter carboniphilus]
MGEIGNLNIKLTGKLEENDYEDINNLQNLCLKVDQTALKLELDYKLGRGERKSENLNNINEFMYYDRNKLIGYIGIGNFGGDTIEVNGMVHPDYRRRGVFKRLFSLVKDEWNKRESQKMLLLSDTNSISGLEFIKYTCASYDHSEYEMFLKSNARKNVLLNNVALRKATNNDAKEIAWQDSIYFDIEYKAEDISMPEEEEKYGSVTYIAEIDNKTIGKVRLEIIDGIGGIYGLGVLPEYRGKGYGREILTCAIEKLKEKNAKDIMLQVSVKNKSALNLYQSCGFEETSTMDYYKISKK